MKLNIQNIQNIPLYLQYHYKEFDCFLMPPITPYSRTHITHTQKFLQTTFCHTYTLSHANKLLPTEVHEIESKSHRADCGNSK